MTVAFTLTESEIKDAITLWLKAKGKTLQTGSAARDIYIWQDRGDPPVTSPQIYARAQVND